MEKTMSKVTIAIMTACMSSQVTQAASFALYTETSPAAIGNYAAGIAAEAGDAATAFYNPAGLVFLHKKQMVFGGTGVFPSYTMSGNSTFTTTPFPAYTQNVNGLKRGRDALVPSFHYAQPLGERAAFGLSFFSPFGLSTNWGNTSPVRYQGTTSSLQMIDISPDIAGQITDNLSFGAGVDLQWATVKFNRVLGSPAQLQFVQSVGGPVTPTTFDSLSYNKGSSLGVGFHMGVLTFFNENHTRVGLNYQSSVTHLFEGYSELTGRLADTALPPSPGALYRSDSLFTNDIQLPDVVTLSAYQDMTAQLALLGSVVYTGWKSFKTLSLFNVAAFSPAAGPTPVNSSLHENYKNAWRVALGANYHLNDSWMMRVGGGYDQTPTNDADRDVRLPDSNRFALSIGAHYQPWEPVGFDIGYTYLFADQAVINKTDLMGTTASYNVNTKTNVHAQLVGLQAVWTMDKPMVATK